MSNYQTNQQLKNCLQGMYDGNPGLNQPKFKMNDPKEVLLLSNDPLERLLVQHDSQHFIFGSGTDIEGELALQITVFFLSNKRWSEILTEYYNVDGGVGPYAAEGVSAYQRLGFLKGMYAILCLIAHFFKTISKRLLFTITGQELFPFSQTHKMLDLTLDDIRFKYNIKPYNQN